MVLIFLIIAPFIRWTALGLLLLIWGFALVQLRRGKSLSAAQRKVKITLNTLLFLLVALFLFQPALPGRKKGEALLIYDAGIPLPATDSVKTVYKIKQGVSYKEFRKKFRDYADHRFFFFGQEAEPQVLSYLAGKEVHWIPWFAPGTLQEVGWRGVLRKGERQTVSGKISLSRPGTIRLIYGSKTLDSLSLGAGFNAFQLSFPVFSEGRSRVFLQLEERPLRDIAFYARPARPLAITMLLDHPDFESRILAEWLGTQGHYVEISTPVARSVLYESRVNKSSERPTPDLVITTPSHAGDARVRKAIAERRSVLFFALGDDVTDALSRINRATGTAFSARRISAQESLPLKNELTAMPYQLAGKPNQRQVGSWPVSLQKRGARVAVSLMNETFPARLSGDTLTYSEMWREIMAALDASDSMKAEIHAPVFRDIPAKITLQTGESLLPADKDTLFLRSSRVNPARKSGEYRFTAKGWQPLYAVGEVFAEDSLQAGLGENWLKANAILLKSETPSLVRPVSATIWFWAFLFCLAALWTEAKFRY